MTTTVVEAQVQSNKEGIKELRKIVIGNGEIGMDETVRRIYSILKAHVKEDTEEEERAQKKSDKIQAGIIIGLVVEGAVLLGSVILLGITLI